MTIKKQNKVPSFRMRAWDFFLRLALAFQPWN